MFGLLEFANLVDLYSDGVGCGSGGSASGGADKTELLAESPSTIPIKVSQTI